jgi:hypothetical protein
MHKYLFIVNHYPKLRQGYILRFIGKLTKLKQYIRYSNIKTQGTKYRKELDLTTLKFVKALL